MKSTRVEISFKTIIFTALFVMSLALLWKIRSILILFFISFIFMEAVNPTINKLQKLKIPRVLAILLIYILLLAVIFIAFAGIVPILIEQTTGLVNTLPNIIQNFTIFGTSAVDLSSQFKILEAIPGNIAKTALSIFTDLFSMLVIFVITFYFLLERKNFDKYGYALLGEEKGNKVLTVIDNLEKRLGSWVNAELLLITVVGILSYIGYLFLGLKYAVPLAILAGLLEIVPNIGPIVAGILAALVGLTISPLTALLALGWGFLIQQFENNIIVPKVMKETVGLNPIITIFILAIGASLGGIMGAVLAIPIYLTIEVVVKAFVSFRENKKL